MRKPVGHRTLMIARPISFSTSLLVHFCTFTIFPFTSASSSWLLSRLIQTTLNYSKLCSWLESGKSFCGIFDAMATFFLPLVYFPLKYGLFQIMMPSGKVLAKMWNVSMSLVVPSGHKIYLFTRINDCGLLTFISQCFF